MTISFSIARLSSLDRPAGYLDDCRAAAIDPAADPLVFDVDSPAYKALRERYAAFPRERRQLPPPTPIPDDYDPQRSPDSPRAGGCCDPVIV